MSDQRIDHIFKEKLGEGTMSVPQVLWDNIEPYLPTVRKRRRWGLIWIAGAALLLMSAALLWMTSTAKTEAVQPSQQTALTTNPPSPFSAPAPEHHTAAMSSITSNETSTPSENAVIPLSTRQKQNKRSGPISTRTTEDVQATSTVPTTETTEDLQQLVQTRTFEEQGNISQQLKSVTPTLSASFSLLSTPFLRRLPDPAKDCYRFGKKNSGGGGIFFAEAYLGPGFASRKMSSRTEDVSSYIAQRDSTENARLSWHTGLRLGYWHHSGLTARIGGHYTQVNALFDYVDGSYVGTITRIDTLFDGGGNIIDIDTVLIPVSGQRIKKTHNRYHTIDIPLLVGYQVTQGNWIYGVQAGPVFNVAFIQKGDILDPTGQPVSISSNNSAAYPVYKDKLGISLYASAHIGYRIGYRMWAYAEPYLHHRTGTLTLETYPIDQRQTNVGLSLGLRVTLQ